MNVGSLHEFQRIYKRNQSWKRAHRLLGRKWPWPSLAGLGRPGACFHGPARPKLQAMAAEFAERGRGTSHTHFCGIVTGPGSHVSPERWPATARLVVAVRASTRDSSGGRDAVARLHELRLEEAELRSGRQWRSGWRLGGEEEAEAIHQSSG
jgi:hypothetical protein